MKKILSVVAALLCLTLIFSSCGTTAEDSTAADTTAEDSTAAVKAEINIGLLKGPTGMGAAVHPNSP